MASFPLLDPTSEELLHKARLFNTDERAFRRVHQRLLSDQSLLVSNGRIPPKPRKKKKKDLKAAKKKEEEKPDETPARNAKDEFLTMRDDILLDYANFESSLVRMQLLLNSNELERQRYHSEKVRIQAAAQDVKHNTAELRVQLEDAQNQLALRKEYDKLAEKILSNRLLKPREDQAANIEKLNNEILELERESRDYAATWSERREQFGKIVEEGMQLRRLIRDEKEEVERREGMEGRDEQDDADGISTRGRSAANTPRPEAGGATPLHAGSEGGDPNSLAPDRYSMRGKSPFRISTPIPEEGTPQPSGTDVYESMEGRASMQDMVSSPSEGLVAEDDEDGEVDEGESASGDDRRVDDSMDTT